jgi:hypothetical protein
MKKKTRAGREKAEAKSAVAHSEDSRNSNHGYMEMGNDAEVQAKARALRNNDNGSHM